VGRLTFAVSPHVKIIEVDSHAKSISAIDSFLTVTRPNILAAISMVKCTVTRSLIVECQFSNGRVLDEGYLLTPT